MKAPKSAFEQARLAALRSYDILDTPRERDFDDIVTIAAAICQTEAATITFVDADRQWFKAAVGMPPEVAPLEFAICAHTIVHDGFLEIGDTRLDPRTADNPGVRDPINLRFYAGAQLVSGNGHPIGTLCVLGMTAKQLTPVQRNALQVLANQVMTLLDLRVALATADILRREVDHRVKNSLQLVGSLIGMQSRASHNTDVQDALSQTRERVLALASLHDTMQQANSRGSVDLGNLITDLCILFRKALTNTVTVESDIPDIEVSASVASSVAVIVNEFASNSLKHAFDEGAAGTIRFVGRPLPGGMVELVCSDDGRGVPADLDSRPQAGRGLGLAAMHACARQIGGQLTVTPQDRGYQMVLRFDPGLVAAAAAQS